eukprot:gene9013-11034_t
MRKNIIDGSNTSNITKYYDFGSQIGSGKFSVVKSATEKSTGKQWAVKIMKKSVVEEQTLVREVEIMREIKNPNIISLHEIFETENEILLVLELVTGGELFDKIVERVSYTEEDASKLVNTLTKVIQYLHNKDIVHCDLKPENLLYSDNSEQAIIKLCDFGLSQRCPQGTSLRSLVGSLTYMAPEINNCTGYGKPADLWALGVIVYILLCGFPPFDETTGYVLEFPSPEWDNISDSAKGLIKSLLVIDPAKRLTAAQTLKHSWISGVSVGKQSIIGTLKTLREFNTLRRSGTTMGYNKQTRGTVFELFPSLTPTKSSDLSTKILKKQLMASLESDLADYSSETTSSSPHSDRLVSPVLTPNGLTLSMDLGSGSELLTNSASGYDIEKQKIIEQLKQEKILLQKELEELKKDRQNTPLSSSPSTPILSKPVFTGELSFNSVLSISSGSHSRTASSDEKRDKSKYGVDKIVSDIQSEIDKISLPKEHQEKIASILHTYRLKNQEKSLKLQLEKQKDKYKKLKLQMKKEKNLTSK